MKESVLRAAAIAALALGLIMSVTTWIGLSTSSHRGSFFLGFFEFALILFLGVVAWALFNALADIVTVRTSMDVLSVRMRRIEEALGVELPAAPEAGRAGPRRRGETGGESAAETAGDAGQAGPQTAAQSDGSRAAEQQPSVQERPPSDEERTPSDQEPPPSERKE